MRRALLTIATLLAAACSSSAVRTTTDPKCTPGEWKACAGPGQCEGFQTCNADGTAFSSCECGSGGAGGGSTGGSAGAGAAGGLGGSAAVAGSGGSAAVAGSGGMGASGATGGTAGAGGAGGAPTCDMPALLVGLENLTQPGSGRVLRFSLAGGTATPCSDLTGGVPKQPFAVGWIPSGHVAVATWSELTLIDPVTNRSQWIARLGTTQDFPVSVFPLRNQTGTEWRVAVAYRGSGTADVRNVYSYDLSGNERDHWTLNTSQIPLGPSWTDMTANPLAPSHLLATSLSNGIAWREVDPYANATVNELATTRALHTLRAHDTRMAFVGDESSSHDSVYYLTGTGQVSPPTGCTGRTCEYVDAVPDPASDAHYIALCGQAGSVLRSVVRFDAAGACTTLFDAATLGTGWRLSQLATAD